MSLFQWPFKRISRPTLGNPVFIDDVLAANQAVLDGIGYLFNNTPFAIVSGLTYTPGSPGSYAPGLVWLNGSFCWVSGISGEGLFLTATSTDTNPEPYSDTNSRPTYTLLQATAGATGAQLLSGDMSQYRMDLLTLKTAAISAASTISSLGDAAFVDIGNTAGTVAAGNDPRLVGDLSFFDGRYVQPAQVIVKGAGTAYTPTAPTDPVNKGYVDNGFIKKLASGNTNVGDVPSGGADYACTFGTTLPDTNYMPIITLLSNGTPSNDASLHAPVIHGLTTTGFLVRLQEGVGTTQNISIRFTVLSM